MKLKLVSIIVLISLLFTIAHDYILVKEIDKKSCHSTPIPTLNLVDSCCQDLAEMHHFFHIIAINIDNFEIKSFLTPSVKIDTLKHFSFIYSLQTLFRPPIN